MQALGRLPSWVNIPEAPAAHFQPVHDDGERCDLFKEPRNPQGVKRHWSRGFARAGATEEQRKHPDTLPAKASHRFAIYEKDDAHADRELIASMKEAGRGWLVESPHGEKSLHNRLFYSRVNGAKMLRSYAHFKGWCVRPQTPLHLLQWLNVCVRSLHSHSH